MQALELVSITSNPTLNFKVPAWYLRAGQSTAVVRLWLTSGEGGIATASENFEVIPVECRSRPGTRQLEELRYQCHHVAQRLGFARPVGARHADAALPLFRDDDTGSRGDQVG